VDNVRAKNFIIPRALLPDKHHIWWAGGLQRCKGSLGKGALIPNNQITIIFSVVRGDLR